jgi:hypothetical protein
MKKMEGGRSKRNKERRTRTRSTTRRSDIHWKRVFNILAHGFAPEDHDV